MNSSGWKVQIAWCFQVVRALSLHHDAQNNQKGGNNYMQREKSGRNLPSNKPPSEANPVLDLNHSLRASINLNQGGGSSVNQMPKRHYFLSRFYISRMSFGGGKPYSNYSTGLLHITYVLQIHPCWCG